MPPYKLDFKINGVYMLLRNMKVSDGLCNGTRSTLRKIDGHILTYSILHDDKLKKGIAFLMSSITTKTPSTHFFSIDFRILFAPVLQRQLTRVREAHSIW
jgi:hypothetical protein